MKLAPTGQRFVKQSSCAELHRNPTNGLATYIRLPAKCRGFIIRLSSSLPKKLLTRKVINDIYWCVCTAHINVILFHYRVVTYEHKQTLITHLLFITWRLQSLLMCFLNDLILGHVFDGSVMPVH